MKLLLDTHVILWSIAQPEKLAKPVAQRLQDPSNELWFSPISIWKILLLAEKGRIFLKDAPEKEVRQMIQNLPLKEAVLNREVTLPHEDPADRFLAATAVVYGLTLVTADRRMIEAKDVPVLAAV